MENRYRLSSLFASEERFDPERDWIDLAFIERGAPLLEALSLWFRPSFVGIENVPSSGPALLVGNHGIIGFDAFFVFMAVYRATGRMPRGLGDHHLFVEPISRRFWRRLGALDGNPEVGLRWLEAGHLLNVYPGGARDSLKSPEGRYRLHWDKSFGFVRLAMRAGVPVVLHMGIGPDDTYRILRRLRFTGRLLGHPKYELPLYWGWGLLPRPVKFTYYFSEPIRLEGGPAGAEDTALVERNHERLWLRGQAMLDEGLRQRRSVWWG
jgi:1-acyl-sn-glycerol-3-phosphate acyltransferase